MAVDYEEGRRLLAEVKQWETRKGTPEYDVESHSFAIIRTNSFVVTHAEALLNPDPWRPISEATSDMPDDVKYVLAHKDDPEWICLADGPPEDGRWYSDGWHVEPTHFRELKGPGQQ